MIKNNKQSCIDSISASISRTAKWRRGLQAKYPSDSRLGQAAETLDMLAGQTSDLSDEAWSELARFYGWNSETWHDGVSKASRLVEFQCSVRTFSDFVNNLVGILSEQHVNH